MSNNFPYNLIPNPNHDTKKYINTNLGTPRVPLIRAEQKRRHDLQDKELKELLQSKKVSGIYKHYININSKKRSKDDTLTLNDQINMPNNPLTFTSGSRFMKLNYPNHGLGANDLIYITNIPARQSIFKNPFECRQGTNFLRIEGKHGIIEDYNRYDDIFIEISNVANPVGNISANQINGFHKVLLTCNYSSKPFNLQQADNSSSAYNNNYMYIELPFLSNSSYSDLQNNTNSNVTIRFLYVAGIPLYYINNGQPSDITHLESWTTIYNIQDDNTILIKLPREAGESLIYGGSYIYVSKVKVSKGFPDANNYSINLGRTYNNVVSARLLSLDFPLVSPNLKIVTKQNNKLYWSDGIDSVNNIYELTIPEGCYTPTSLAEEINKQSKTVKVTTQAYSFNIITKIDPFITSFPPDKWNTRFPFYREPEYHDIKVDINMNTNLVSFKNYRKNIMLNSIFIWRVDDYITRMYIILPNHNLQKGDKIIIENAPNVGIIPSNIINREHTIDRVNELLEMSTNNLPIALTSCIATIMTQAIGTTDLQTILNTGLIRIILPAYNQIANPGTIPYTFCPQTTDLITFDLYIPDDIKLYFDKNDTIGNLLGFRNIGNMNSITIFDFPVTNASPYIKENGIKQITNNIRQNSINMIGDSFVYLCCPQLSNIEGTLPVNDVFVKINLENKNNINSDSKNIYLYNNYTDIPKYFNNPISKLTSLDISFRCSDNSLYDFRGLDHSFIIEIQTIESQPDDVDVSSRTGLIGKHIIDPTVQTIIRNHPLREGEYMNNRNQTSK